ncbi:hypothetical protein [Haloparvum sp. PAK95]|uniref:hypothetical protein n=1 Tax=Haloparvum sp. PAK95 TaxID=3418962 RepID=UPI003D2F4D4C
MSHEDGPPESVDSPEELLERMEPFEPYTDEEFARDLDVQKRKARQFLERLEEREEVRRTQPAGAPAIWIREPNQRTCPGCDRAFTVKYAHAIFGGAQFCPNCGERL